MTRPNSDNRLAAKHCRSTLSDLSHEDLQQGKGTKGHIQGYASSGFDKLFNKLMVELRTRMQVEMTDKSAEAGPTQMV